MKLGHTLLFISLIFYSLAPFRNASAQIPNPGFENWTGGAPDGWATNNFPGFAVPVTQSTTARSGSSALQGTVVDFQGFGGYPPVVTSFFPVSQRFATLSGFYRFTPMGGDSLFVFVLMYGNAAMNFIGAGEFVGSPTGASYQPFSAPIMYVNNDTPDSCFIEILITGEDSVHIGSTMLIDDLLLSGTATSVGAGTGTPVAYSLDQNYPNPFNPVTFIRYSLPEAGSVQLSVFNMLGEEVVVLVDEQQPAGAYRAEFNAGNLPSGTYFYRLRSGEFSQVKKLLLLK